MNLTTVTYFGHDPEAWVCTRCGLIRDHEFSWAHRPATNPGIRTCGGRPVPARLYHYIVELLKRHRQRVMMRIADLESGKLPDTGSGAYGLWQTL